MKKEEAETNIIDFGFSCVSSPRPRHVGFRFSARKLQEDIKYIKDEVIWDMFIEPMLIEDKSKQDLSGRKN
jgi:hypothetical protein